MSFDNTKPLVDNRSDEQHTNRSGSVCLCRSSGLSAAPLLSSGWSLQASEVPCAAISRVVLLTKWKYIVADQHTIQFLPGRFGINDR